jgi:hypothetical protein
MKSKRLLNAVSEVKCEIFRDGKGAVFLQDMSSSCTWVNGSKVCKDRMWPLEHNAEICFTGSCQHHTVTIKISERWPFLLLRETIHSLTIPRVL